MACSQARCGVVHISCSAFLARPSALLLQQVPGDRLHAAMEARFHHYSGARLLQMQAPGPAAAGAVPEARPFPDADDATERAFTLLNGTAITILAVLVCGLVAALALHVVLHCALRVTRRARRDDGEHGQQQAGSRHGSSSRNKKMNPRRSALVQALPCLAYFAGLGLAGSSRSECAICLAEFARGDRVRVLPRCNHGFHARCIDRWLAARPTCPTCRQPPFADEQPVLVAQPDDADRVVEQPAGAVQPAGAWWL
jgi:E3 ubiquitin-protein ligase ATL10/75/76/77/78